LTRTFGRGFSNFANFVGFLERAFGELSFQHFKAIKRIQKRAG
jgi:hypothetical protein